MITILTAFKNFQGEDAIRQLRAVESWMLSFPDAELLVYGKPANLESLPFDYVNVDDIPMLDNRLVRIDAMFEHAQKHGRHDLQMYVNGDMILGPDFAVALTCVTRGMLCVGQRWDTNTLCVNPLEDKNALMTIQRDVKQHGKLHPPNGMDYFVFLRGELGNVKPLHLGTVGWDNYMVLHALKRRMCVLDLSPSVVAVHQNHGYTYLQGGYQEFTKGDAACDNKRYMGELLRGYDGRTIDATHKLINGKVVPARDDVYVERRMERLYYRHPWLRTSRLPWKLKWLYVWSNLYAGV